MHVRSRIRRPVIVVAYRIVTEGFIRLCLDIDDHTLPNPEEKDKVTISVLPAEIVEFDDALRLRFVERYLRRESSLKQQPHLLGWGRIPLADPRSGEFFRAPSVLPVACAHFGWGILEPVRDGANLMPAFVDTRRILLRQGLQKFVDILCHAPARSVDDDMVALPRFVFPRNDF